MSRDTEDGLRQATAAMMEIWAMLRSELEGSGPKVDAAIDRALDGLELAGK